MSGEQSLACTRFLIPLLGGGYMFQIDVSDEGQVRSLVAEAASWGGRLDVWINNAAKFVFGEATTATDAGTSSMHCRHLF